MGRGVCGKAGPTPEELGAQSVGLRKFWGSVES